jgi:hypothetical protein
VVREELQSEERSDEVAAPPELRGARGVTIDGLAEQAAVVVMVRRVQAHG